MAERLEAAFGVRPFDLYATTEGLYGDECERHDGVHLFEDASVVENVDERRPCGAAPATPGARILVTQLHNRVLPLIRLAVVGRVDAWIRSPARAGGGWSARRRSTAAATTCSHCRRAPAAR